MNWKVSLRLSCLLLFAGTTRAQYNLVSTINLGGFSQPGALIEPYGVAVNLTNNYYYFTESGGGRVFVSTTNGTSVLYSGFTDPRGIIVARGGLVVADAGSQQLRLVSLGRPVTVSDLAGVPNKPGTNDGPASSALFNTPTGLALDSVGNIYIADQLNNKIRKLTTSNTVQTVILGGAPLSRPSAVAVDDQDQLLVADTGHNAIKIYDRAGNLTRTVPTEESPRGLVWIGGDTGFAYTSSAKHRVDLESLGIGQSGVAGKADGLPQNAQFNTPAGLARDAESSLIVADMLNNSLRKIVPSRVPNLSELPRPSLPQGVYNNNIAVTFTSPLSNSVIRYVTNISGAIPSFAAPIVPVPLIISNATALSVAAYAPDWALPIVANFLAYNFEVAPPVIITPIGVPSDSTYHSDNDVLIKFASVTSNVVFYYTLDGTEPITFSSQSSNFVATGFLYDTNGLILDQSASLRVAGRRATYADSISRSLDVFLTNAPPVMDPPGATASNDVRITLSSKTTNTLFSWTIDGSEPTLAHGVKMTNGQSFVLGTNGLLKLASFKTGYQDSAVVSNVFSLAAAPPLVIPLSINSNNLSQFTLTNATAGVVIYWTINGSDPSPTNGFLYTGPFTPGTNGTLRFRAFRDGYDPSPIGTADFQLIVSDPIVSPAGLTTNNSVSISITNATLGATTYWTIDGSEPSATNGTVYSGPFTLATNGVFKAKAVEAHFADSKTVSYTFNLSVARPVISPPGSTNFSLTIVTITNATPATFFYYTLDGVDPTTNSLLYTAPLAIGTNLVLKVKGFRSGFLPSETVTASFSVKVDAPVLSPDRGFFPDGTYITASISNSAAKIYYRLDGVDPTTNDTLYTGPIRFYTPHFVAGRASNPEAEMSWLRLRAFADGVQPSDIVTGLRYETNTIGVPRSVFAGAGAKIVIPITALLKTNEVLRSLQYRVQIAPSTSSIPNLASPIEGLVPTGRIDNSFVPIQFGITNVNATAREAAYQLPGPAGVVTNGFQYTYLGGEAQLLVSDHALVGLLAIAIPGNAPEGATYTIEIVEPSGTQDGLGTPTKIVPGPKQTITVKSIPYVVGDLAPSGFYNAGDFGNGNLDNSDVNAVFNASLGIQVPYPFTDAFDAMDVFPPDTANKVGGDGLIRFLDWQTLLDRSIRNDPSNWKRAWVAGSRKSTAVSLPSAPDLAAESISSSSPIRAWFRQGLLGASAVDKVRSGGPVDVPIYLNVKPGFQVAGLQFRAIVLSENGAPDLLQPITFLPAPGMPAPSVANVLAANQIGAAWSFGALKAPLTGNSNSLGVIRIQIPASAGAGNYYSIHFANVDGAPDLGTQYDFESLPGDVWVQIPAAAPAERLPDEWKLAFFGSLTDPSAQADADPNGDGVSNWNEYLAGTNPNGLRLQVLDAQWRLDGFNGFTLRWFAALGRTYAVESSSDLLSWASLATIPGTGTVKEYKDLKPRTGYQYYRVRQMP